MIHRGVADRSGGTYDVCIIGSGPAGLTLVNEIVTRDTRARVCVLESGRERATTFADELRALDSHGIQVTPHSRERVFGGTSSTWTGRSSPLDPIDFEQRPWVPFSGWPFGPATLEPYYALAAERYRFPHPSLFRTDAWADVLRSGDVVPRWNNIEGKVFLTAEVPQHFGALLEHLFHSERADLYLDSTAVRLEGDSSAGAARAAVVRSSGGAEGRIHARVFVLACGAIENARLLLLSTYACPQGLGNERDQVGRYLMNHPKGRAGIIRPTTELRRLPAFFGFAAHGFSGTIGLRLTDASQRKRALLNGYLRLEPAFAWTDTPAAEALAPYLQWSRSLLRGSARAATTVTEREHILRARSAASLSHPERFRMIWNDRNSLGQFLKHRAFGDGPPPVQEIRLFNFMEMRPDPDNRVTLGRRRDRFGTPLPVVNHQVTELGRRSMQELHDVLREEVRGQGWGTLVSDLHVGMDPWPLDQDASHHIGTTRMGRAPRDSVVDEHCRVHSTPNVFVAGSSVFPTAGNVNPTLTIVALAIRLAEHLAGRPPVPRRAPRTTGADRPDAGSDLRRSAEGAGPGCQLPPFPRSPDRWS